MTLRRLIGILIVAFLIEEPIANALIQGICEKSLFFCVLSKLILLVCSFALIYWAANQILGDENS